MALDEKLYPPGLEGKLPAFAGSMIKIPFTLNRAVGYAQINGVTAIIKTVQTNTIIGTTFSGYTTYDENTGNYYAFIDLVIRDVNGNPIESFYSSSIDVKKVYPGQYYKIQLAFNNTSGRVGYYSTIGIIKCTTTPTLTIPSITDNYYGSYEYIGTYSQAGNGQDKTEKIYSYQFDLRDGQGNIVASSGEQIHNSSLDTETNQSSDSWSIKKNLTEGLPYYLTYSVTTMNGLTAQSQSYVIIQQETISPNIPCWLIAAADQEDGCIQLYLRPKEAKTMNGSYILARSSSEDNFGSWNEIYRFAYKRVAMNPRDPHTSPDYWDINDILIWEDFTVKQGVKYIYSIQAYNANGLFSTRQLNTEELLDDSYATNPTPDDGYHTKATENPVYIYVDFEDMFLFDGDRQLKIRFNPKVSSFKSTIMETKVDTLGGKYPFIFRNGNVEYKEFPISGLLSLISDPNERFLQGIQQNVYLTRQEALAQGNTTYELDTQLTGNNISREREFKMSALAWLTNGKPKLFRSPTEGNFIVRLMNSSMSPNDTLGRMLHTFTSTAYEVAEYSFDNLNSMGFIKAPYLGDNRILKIGQIQLATELINYKNKFPLAYMGNFTYMVPGTIVIVDFMNGQQQEIEIGGTGCYYIQLKDQPVRNISLKDPTTMYWGDGKFTYCYFDVQPTDNFSAVSNLSVHDEFKQIIGRNTYVVDNMVINGFEHNVLDDFTDIRREIGKFHYIKIMKRPIQTIYILDHEDGTYDWSYNSSGNDLMRDLDWNKIMIYRVMTPGVNGTFQGYIYNCDIVGSYFGKELAMTEPDCRFALAKNRKADGTAVYDSIVDFGGNAEYEMSKDKTAPETLGRMEALTNVKNVTGLFLGSGVVIDISYRLKEIEYVVENEILSLNELKSAWLIAKADYDNNWSTASTGMMNTLQRKMDNAYEAFVNQLIKELADRGELEEVAYALR